MDLLASRVAQGPKNKAKNINKVNKLSKSNAKKKEEKIIPKVDSVTLKKPSKKQKIKQILTDITSKKKQLIKETLTKSDNTQIVRLSKENPINTTKIKKSKSKVDSEKPVNVSSKKNKSTEEKLIKVDKLPVDKKDSLPKLSKKDKFSKKKSTLNKKNKDKFIDPNLLKNESVKEKTKSEESKENKKVAKKVEETKISSTEDDSKSVKKLKVETVKPTTVESNQEIKSIKSKKRKVTEIETEEPKSPATSTLTKKEIKQYVTALYQVIKNAEKDKKSLFDSEKPPILVQVTCIKIPKVPLHQLRILLPHSILSSTDDVALIVKDLKKGRRRDFEDTIHHYEDILQQHGCTNIKTIIPLNQVKTEYRQFEMRRRLLNSYDYFLVDGRITGHIAHLLGKVFREKRKLPTPIHMDKKDLKAEIDFALRKTCLQIHSTGDSSTVQIGNCSMTVSDVSDNIMALIDSLSKNFPGGWDNIRSLRLKTPLGISIPIYMTLKSKNDVKVPEQAPKRPKAYKDVEGELSTFRKNTKVIVTPEGTVRVIKTGDDTDEEPENDESSGDEKNNTTKNVKTEKKYDIIAKAEENDNSSNDEKEDEDEDEDQDASEDESDN